jgi:hypothetical protein
MIPEAIVLALIAFAAAAKIVAAHMLVPATKRDDYDVLEPF